MLGFAIFGNAQPRTTLTQLYLEAACLDRHACSEIRGGGGRGGVACPLRRTREVLTVRARRWLAWRGREQEGSPEKWSRAGLRPMRVESFRVGAEEGRFTLAERFSLCCCCACARVGERSRY